MTWFSPADGLSEKAEATLKEMAESGSSETSGVADILNTIAENGDGMQEDFFLLNCAEEIIEAAKRFIDDVKPPLTDMLISMQGEKIGPEGEFYIYKIDEDHGTPPSRMYLSGSQYLWTAFRDRAYAFASRARAEDLIAKYPKELKFARVAGGS